MSWIMIYLAADHAGFERKELIKKYLDELGYEVKDFGAETLNPKDDYPDYAYPLAQAVAKDDTRGLLFCGNAQGVCIVANKVSGVRAALGYSEYGAVSSREDDASNVLCVPGRALTDEEAMIIVKSWLETEFSGEERHKRRLSKIEEIEKNQSK
jgi:ribose 5-phosphate isomerase B